MSMRYWTEFEVQYLKDCYVNNIPPREMAKVINRKPGAISMKAMQLGITYKAKDVVGLKYGRLTVLKEIGRTTHSAIMLCSCDCGNTTEVVRKNLIRGWVKSCGCLFLESKRKNPGLSTYNKLYRTTQLGAKKRNIECTLSKDQHKEIISKDCHYCGCSPRLYNPHKKTNGDILDCTKVSKVWIEKCAVLANTIDRVDSSKGYTIENCVPACWTCNKMKSDMNVDVFLNTIKKIALFMKKEEET